MSAADAQREAFAAIERAARQVGRGDIVDGWGTISDFYRDDR